MGTPVLPGVIWSWCNNSTNCSDNEAHEQTPQRFGMVLLER